MNRYATAVLWFALAVQAGWVVLNSLFLHRSPGLDALGVVILVTFTAFAAVHSRLRWGWLTVLVRTLMAVGFLLAVADRFGVLGPPGAPGVSWGNFTQFVDYTRSMTTFLPGGLAPTLAVLATIAELALAAALLLGVRLQLAALGAALLLAVYGTSMMISLPAAEQFHYNVFVLGAGMLTLATNTRSLLTIDAAWARLRYTRHTAQAPPPGSAAQHDRPAWRVRASESGR